MFSWRSTFSLGLLRVRTSCSFFSSSAVRLPCFPRLHGTFKDDHSLYFVMDALE